MEVVWMVLMIILAIVLLTTPVVIVTTQTTVQSIVLRSHMDVYMEFAVQIMEPVIITLQKEDMNVTVHQNGYLCLVVEDHMYHVVVPMIILVGMVEHVTLLLE